jgi:monoamine oxidase
MAAQGPDDRVTFAGGLGAITRQLAAVLARSHADRMYAGATTVAVVPDRGRVIVTYVRDGEVKSLQVKSAIIAIPKFIARRVVAGLPAAQSQAMARIPYAPYAVVNLIFDRPVFNRGYDTWCPGNAFTDFVVADWVIRNRPGYRQRNNILTCYTPLAQTRRAELLTEEGCRRLAARVLSDFCKLFPKASATPVEVHLYRRGHPMMVSAPRIYTEVLPAARRPLERVFFANTDSRGPVSTTDGAIAAAHHAVEEVHRLFAGRSAEARTSSEAGVS